MSLTRQGDFHLVVGGAGVALGEGFPGLEVLPAAVAEAASELQYVFFVVHFFLV